MECIELLTQCKCSAVVLDRIGSNPSLEIMATIDVLPVRVPSSDTMTNINRQLNQGGSENMECRQGRELTLMHSASHR